MNINMAFPLRKQDHLDRADIYNPPPVALDRDITQVTIGDLHANPIKLLYMLARHGICDINAISYKRLATLYQTLPQHQSGDTEATRLQKNRQILTFRNEFRQLLNHDLKIVNKNILVRLIGDVLADRGKNDLLVLDLLDVLYLNGVSVTTELSNHDGIFIDAFQNKVRTSKQNANKDPSAIDEHEIDGALQHSVYLAPGQANSLDQLSELIRGDEATPLWEEIVTMANRAYFSGLKLIDYSIGEDGNISIFSHAPIDFEVIELMAKKFGVPYRPQTIETLAETIDLINQNFTKEINGPLGFNNNLFHIDKMGAREVPVNKKDVIEYAMWNRNEDLTGFNTPPGANYITTWVHGHTKGGLISDPLRRVINLDNALGKIQGNNVPYDVLISNESLKRAPTLPKNTTWNNFSNQQRLLLKTLSDALIKLRQTYPLSNPNGLAIHPLLFQLETATHDFQVNKIDFSTFKSRCLFVLERETYQLNQPHSFFEKVHHALVSFLRAFFHLFDLGWVVGAETMAEKKQTPFAKALTGRDQFFPPPETALGRRAAALSKEFTQTLHDLEALEPRAQTARPLQ